MADPISKAPQRPVVVPKSTDPLDAPKPPAMTAPIPVATDPAAWQAKTKPAGTPATAPAPAPQGQEIICPVLRAMVAEGRVKMAPDGTVKLDDLRAAVEKLGATGPLGAALWGIGANGNQLTDIAHNLTHGEFNVKELPIGVVPHPSDTGILRQGQFNEAKFDTLVSHAENGVMTTDSFARAIGDNYRRDVGAHPVDSSVRGVNFAQVEFAGLLAVFGKTDPATGKKGISVADLRTLYQDGKLPPGMLGDRASLVEATALSASLAMKVDANVAGHAFNSVLTATGISRAGARLSEGGADDKAAAQQASAGAGKAASCPALNGGIAMPKAPADVINAHTPAGRYEINE